MYTLLIYIIICNFIDHVTPIDESIQVAYSQLSYHSLVRYHITHELGDYKLEIVDQWSTRIPPPHRRGWQWAMGGLQLNIVQNHKAAILKAT